MNSKKKYRKLSDIFYDEIKTNQNNLLKIKLFCRFSKAIFSYYYNLNLSRILHFIFNAF